ncbi:MAG: hypothetical protein HY071_05335 [Chloroflexi bacterium]|nr:hypothetical protein [Chloroflexota bacterium]
MIDPWPRLLRAASEFPLDTTEAAIAALSPSASGALDALRDIHAGRRTIASVLRDFGIGKSEAENRGKVLVYLSRDLGLLVEASPGRYVTTPVGSGLSNVERVLARQYERPAAAPVGRSRRIRRSGDIADHASAHGTRTANIDLDVLSERTAEHQRVVRACAEEFIAQGCEVHEGNFDLLALCGDEDSVLIEAKTITTLSERTQLKMAVGQLFSYEVDDAAALIGGRHVRKMVALNAQLSARGIRVLRALGIDHRVY